MTRAQYGQSWWGAQWLQALTEIDEDNRLPRGRTYANRGAVRDLQIAGGKVSARVQGSRPRPYDVAIEVPPIAPAAAERLTARLAADPGLVARLLNRELDPAVLDVAGALKLPVFPTRFSDLGMDCSCPDWAVPCKHLAAVIYLLSREIDGDPFLVFRLRDVDLPALLARHGLQFDAPGGAALPRDVLALFETATAKGAEAQAEAGTPHDPAALARLDFTRLPDLREALWRVLPAQPVFHRGGDFRALAQKTVAGVARQARGILDSLALAQETGALPDGELRFDLLDGNALPAIGGVSLGGRPVQSLSELLPAVAAIPPARLADLPAEFAALQSLNLLALHLLARGAVAPQVYAVDQRNAAVGLRWTAAELDTDVRFAVDQAALGLPPGLLQRHAKRGGKRTRLAAGVQARVLLSALLDFQLRALADPLPKAADDKIHALFFGAGLARFDGPGERTLAGSIQTWLARLHLGRQANMPMLRIEPAGPGLAAGGFALSIAVAGTRALDAPTPLADVIAKPGWAARRMAVLQTVALLAEFHPPLSRYLRDGARQPLALRCDELPPLLFDALPAMRLIGIRTLLPRALERLLRPRLSMQLKSSRNASAGKGLLDTGTMLSFDWKVAIGSALLSPAEFRRLLGRAGGVVEFRGEYVYLDPAEVESLRTRLERPPRVDAAELLRTALAGEYDGAPVGLDPAAAALIGMLRAETDAPPPAGLQATLRPYQRRGYAWLWRNARLGLGSVIADDMGLGKTLQVLALLLRQKEDADRGGSGRAFHALVIVPTSLLTNWQKEAARFAPGLRVAVFHGAKRELADEQPDLLLTSYGVVRRESARLASLRWSSVVIDEAHNIKNPAAAQTRAVKAIAAPARIAMSGTPVENSLLDYWSIMDFAQRGHLGGAAHFTREYATPIQTHRDAAAAERLRRVLAPFLLRRLKSDRSIIDDLPDKVEQDQYCTLSPEQAALYESVLREAMKAIRGESKTFERQGLVLQLILALKQVCNHPAHYLKQGDADPAASGKTARLLDLLAEIGAAHEKVLIFTQFREMGELLLRMLREHPLVCGGRAPQFLHGGVARAKRDAMVERFQTDPAERVFLLSLKAGGTGLNLTAASHVVHVDLWWNPAVEAQATDRAYRIGQHRNVQVHRFITRGTFEERIDEMIRAKRELAERAVGTGERWIGQLPDDELQALLRLDASARERINHGRSAS